MRQQFAQCRQITLVLPALLALLVAATLAWPLGVAGAAATWNVTKTADTDDGSCDLADCSLREAIAAASPGDTVQVLPDASCELTLNAP